MIGSTTIGTIRKVSNASLGLVMTSNTVPPINNSRLRNATEALAPTTDWIRVVSVVRRERISPVFVTSK